MHIILIPGLWLHGSTWDDVLPPLSAAGHTPQALTLPGMQSREADRTGITLRDHVDAVVEAIDGVAEPILLVGHSVGCGIGHAAVDTRPDRIARAVYVGGFPSPDGASMLLGLPTENGEVAMPDWVEMGEEANISDFEPTQLERFYADAIPAPERVLTDPQRLSDERRYAVPVTAVCPEYTADDLRDWVAQGETGVSELTKITEVEYVDLSGGHWPQLTQPTRLAEVILEAAARV